MIDALRIPDAFITIVMDRKLLGLNLMCFVLNGLMWLGTVLIYKAFTSMLLFYSFGAGEESAGEGVDASLNATQDL